MKFLIFAALVFSLSQSYAQVGVAAGTTTGTGAGTYSTDSIPSTAPTNANLSPADTINAEDLNSSPNPTPNLNNSENFNNSTTVTPGRRSPSRSSSEVETFQNNTERQSQEDNTNNSRIGPDGRPIGPRN